MREEQTEIVIDASTEKVWDILTDLDAYADWNPFAQRASGEVEEGRRLNIYLKPPNGMGATIKPIIKKAKRGEEFAWVGRFPIPGLFEGEHYFRLEPDNGDGTRLVHGERFRGILVPVMGGIISKALEGFVEMNVALKARAESAR